MGGCRLPFAGVSTASISPRRRTGSGRTDPRHPQPRHPVDHVHRQGEPVDLVLDRQFQRGVDVPLLLVPPHVQVLVVRPPVRQPVDQPRVAVEREDDRPVHREQAVKILVRQAVRVFGVRLEPEQIDHVDEPQLQVRELLPQHVRRGQRLLRRDVPGAREDHVRLPAPVGTRLRPDADALRAVDDRLVHAQVLQVILLVRHLSLIHI